MKDDWKEIVKEIEKVVEAPKEHSICANCIHVKGFGYYAECTHKVYGIAKKTDNFVTGETKYLYRNCRDINDGTCKGFEKLKYFKFDEILKYVFYISSFAGGVSGILSFMSMLKDINLFLIFSFVFLICLFIMYLSLIFIEKLIKYKSS